jgi:Protein of unknown function (DUF2975)
MIPTTQDPVLRFTAALVSCLKWINWIAAAIGIIGVIIGAGTLLTGYAINDSIETWAFMALSALVAVGCLLFGTFFKRLREVIDSIGLGSPLTFANTQKLRSMAMLLAGVMIIDIILNFTSPYWMPTTQQDSFDIYADAVTSFLGTLLPVLLLVIVARIFHIGTQMREELEGTV